jgi:pSer/pThr/pTyr-binding forkhead associated (FHA) protein
MPAVTFQVLEGVDKGRIFREMAIPVTIGREEGNVLRLNDERVSRFHAKIQFDNNEIIITDLESTNGTRVNGNVVQIRRLQVGDRIGVGRSLLLFGSEQEIRTRINSVSGVPINAAAGTVMQQPAKMRQETLAGLLDSPEIDLALRQEVTAQQGTLYIGGRALPPLPEKLGPSNAARLSELLEFLHRQITGATENIRSNDDASQVTLQYADWQRILGVQMLLARYVRAVAEPDALSE